MKPTRMFFVTALTMATLSASAWAQTLTAANTAPEAHPAATSVSAPAPVTAADVQALKDALAAQQLQIQRLTEQLEKQQQVQAQQAAAIAADATPASANAPTQVVALGNGMVQQGDPTPGQSAQDQPQTFNKQMEGPITIHFRGINITPGGYSEAAFVRRSRALSADLPTPFNSVTMPGASQSQVSEFFGSGRQSKITTFVSGHAGGVDLSSYVSADFLSAGVTSTSNQTNSYTLRLRQAWGQVKLDNGWSFLGGQIWSLVTENGKGISPDDDLGRTNDARPKTIDPSYNIGFVFARQYGLRITKSFGDKVAFAFGVENPQATLTTHGNAANFLLGQTGASNSYNTTANYSFNPSPDLIAKVAFDPGFGHYEVFGLYDRFTDRIFPCNESYTSGTTVVVSPNCPSATAAATAAGVYNASKNGGGIGASARWNIANRVTFGLKGFGGSGIGRYGPAGLPDVSISPDGTIHPVKNLIGLSTLEFHTKRLDILGYGGVEYAARSYGFDPLLNKGAGADVGYGAPLFNNTGCFSEIVPSSNSGFAPGSLANCTGDTRAVIEGTAGFWYRLYSGPRGRFQFGTQYSYVTRNTWSGAGGLTAGTAHGLEPHGIDNMIFTSFRYYLP
jgi:hypothetical protein